MGNAMVTARMSQSKKDAGNKVLESLGYSASRAINELYDCILETGALPFTAKTYQAPAKEQIALALAFVDSIAIVEPDEFDALDARELKKHKLIAKGHAAQGDFA